MKYIYQSLRNPNPDQSIFQMASIERLKKKCSHAERGFLSFGEALAKEQV
jgi:hypothetical protein